MTSCSQLEELEALVMGELDASATRTLRAHTDGCAACATELAMLVEERALFVRRAAALDVLDPPPAIAATPVRGPRAGATASTRDAGARRILPALGRIAMRGHFTAACAAALFVVAALSRLGTATVSMSINDDVASMSALHEEGAAPAGMLASYRDGEPLSCSLVGSAGSSGPGPGAAAAAPGAMMRDDGAMTTSSSSGASHGEPLACVEPAVTCSALRQ